MSETRPYTTRERCWLSLLAVSSLVFSWLGMQAFHELGHVIHAQWSGGHVVRVVLHPLEISRTDVNPNPHPQFVAWGGPVWGCVLPLVLFIVLFRMLNRFADSNISEIGSFLVGFCFLANGLYIGSGVVYPVGDAEDLLRHGAPVWSLALFGVLALIAAVDLFKGTGLPESLRQKSPWHCHLASHKAALTMAALAVIVIVIELALYHPMP